MNKFIGIFKLIIKITDHRLPEQFFLILNTSIKIM